MINLLSITHLLCILPLAVSISSGMFDSRENNISFNAPVDQQNQITANAASQDGDSSGGLSRAFPNSGCYSYFNARDGCAYRNPTNNCSGKITSIGVQMFEMSALSGALENPGSAGNLTSNTTRSSVSSQGAISKRRHIEREPRLSVRNNQKTASERSASASKHVSLGSRSIITNATFPSSDPNNSSICGEYDSESQMGVCLWSGPDSNGLNSKISGWVSSEITGNCNKEVILQRLGSNSTALVARILEGCSFNTMQSSVGCSQIYVTKKTFMALKPTPSEVDNGVLEGSILWDFNSKQNIFNAAV